MTNPSEYFIGNDLAGSQDRAIICGDQSVSYRQLFCSVAACREKLKNARLRGGDRIALAMPNSLEYIILLLSLWSIKAIACPLSTRLPQGALEDQLKNINAKILITPQKDFFSSAKVTTPQMDYSQFIDRTVLPSGKHDRFDHNFSSDQNATILYTSGSSAQPKAVLHTLDQHVLSAAGSNTLIPVAPGDQWLLSLPLYHVGGLSILFRTFLGMGALVIIQPQEDIKQAVENHSLTHISLVPTQLSGLLSDEPLGIKLKNFKAILIGGDAVPSSLLEKSVQLKLPIYTTYGMTETASQIAAAQYPLPAQIYEHTKLKIADDGEILLTGKTLFCGYVIGNNVRLALNAQGWFATGDIGTLTVEEGLIVLGRKNNMFISGGENIHPEEIEHYICQMDSVEEAVVVPVENEEFGFRPAAFVKIGKNRTVNREELSGFLENRLPKFKIPEQFFHWPTDSSEKRLKRDRRYFIDKIAQKNRTY